MNKPDINKLRILTPEFRVSHPHVFKPQVIKQGDKPTYGIEMLFDKTKTKLSELQAPLIYAAKAKWGEDKEEWPKPLKFPIRDGDKPYGKKKEVKEEHKGMWVVKASSAAEYSKPYVVDRNRDPIIEQSQFYPGCYARAALKAHAYTFADKDGVKFILDGVQFIRDGKAMGGKPSAEQMFGVIEGDDAPEELEDSSLMGEESTDGEDGFM